jgi:hypothetical protein
MVQHAEPTAAPTDSCQLTVVVVLQAQALSKASKGAVKKQ